MDFEEETLKALLRIERDLGYLQAHASDVTVDITEIKNNFSKHIDEFEELLANHQSHIQAVEFGEIKGEKIKIPLGSKKVTIGSVATALATVLIFILSEVLKWF